MLQLHDAMRFYVKPKPAQIMEIWVFNLFFIVILNYKTLRTVTKDHLKYIKVLLKFES